MHTRNKLLFASLTLLLSAAVAQAVKPQTWSFNTQKDFAEGQFENTIVDSYGRLTLGRKLTPIKTDAAAELVSAFAQTPDGSIYVATSPKAKIYKIDGNESTEIYKAPKGFTDITAMAVDSKGELLVALSGDSARLVHISTKDKSAPAIRFEEQDVEYIWAIQPAADGTVYLGTGPHGKIYKLPEHGDAEVVLESKGKNITTLAMDKDNNLLAGTDSPGLVIRLDAKSSNKPFVLLDAGKVDINAIVTDKTGNIYVATAKAEPDSSGAPDSPDEPGGGGKSKPAATEPDSVEPPDLDAVPKNKSKTQGALMIPHDILGAPQQDIPPEIKAILKKAAAEAAAKSPATHKKSPTPSKSKKPSSKSAPDEDTSDTDDISAVYKITPTGAVTTLVQQEDLNYSLLVSGDDLLIGTGDQGKLYRYTLADESLALIARVKQEHITTLFADSSGGIFLGTANTAQVYRLSADLASTGTFTSQPLDASHSADWGHARVDLDLPAGQKATIATRSGNTKADEKEQKFWSDWTPETDASANEKISAPVARYLQIRLTLTGTDNKTPTLNQIKIVYQTENLPPLIKDLVIELPGASSDDPDAENNSNDSANEKNIHINWDATDPNNDDLTYKLYYKQVGEKDIWTPLAKDLSDSIYEWETKSIPDGKYVVKLVASDASDNAAADAQQVARVSTAFVIDHTPPTISDLTVALDSNKVTVSGDAKDEISAISDVRFQIDGQGDWQPALASDKIFDSPHEAFTIVTRPLSTGGHRITVRVTDAKGNSSYKAASVAVKP